MSLKVIYNPAAGHGKAAKYMAAVAELFKRRKVDFEILATRAPGHAMELAQEAASQNCPKVVVVGGDGTISEVANGLIQVAGGESALGIIPVGTGNDLARTLKIPQKLEAAADVVLEGGYHRIDIGVEKDRSFIIVLGLGFPSDVSYQENKEKFFKGSLAFFVAVYKALSKLRSYRVKVEMEGKSFEMNMNLLMIQNAPYCGGGQLMAPGAKIDDGLFDVVIVDEITKMELIWNFPKVYNGTHIKHPKFEVYKTSWIKVYSDYPLPKMFDGDLYGVTPIEAKVLPQSLKVLVPKWVSGVGGQVSGNR